MKKVYKQKGVTSYKEVCSFFILRYKRIEFKIKWHIGGKRCGERL